MASHYDFPQPIKRKKKDQRTFFDFEKRLLITIYINNNNIQQIPLQQYSITGIL